MQPYNYNIKRESFNDVINRKLVMEEKAVINESDKKIRIITDNIGSTLTDKCKKPKDLKRKRDLDVSYKETKSTSKTMNFIKNKLESAQIEQSKSHFKQAAVLYNSVLLADTGKLLTKETYLDSQKNVFLCEMEVWKQSKTFTKNECLIALRKSLNDILTGNATIANKKQILDSFASELNHYALNLVEVNPELAFNHLNYLLEFNLINHKLIEKKLFIDVVDDILYNMTACISNQEIPQAMINSMSLTLKNPLINKESKDKYFAWLEDQNIKDDIKQCFEPAEEQIREEDKTSFGFDLYVMDINENNISNSEYPKTPKVNYKRNQRK